MRTLAMVRTRAMATAKSFSEVSEGGDGDDDMWIFEK